MISHKYKCIFIHIPKCAGTSIEEVLGHFEPPVKRGDQDHRSVRMIQKPILSSYKPFLKNNTTSLLQRLNYNRKEYSNPNNKLTLTKEQYNLYYKFTIVRNPWARAYSWYKNVINDEYKQKELNVSSEITFKNYLKLAAGKRHLRPQTYWLKDYSGKIPLDFIGRFESLNEDFEIVREKLNLPQLKLPHNLKGNTKDYRNYYDEECKKIIEEVYKEEIDIFNYRF